jgi:hypothetical protein
LAIRHLIANCANKAHTALTAPYVLHRTRIGKCEIKKYVSIANCGISFFIAIFHFSLVKAAMNATHLLKTVSPAMARAQWFKQKHIHFFIF